MSLSLSSMSTLWPFTHPWTTLICGGRFINRFNLFVLCQMGLLPSFLQLGASIVLVQMRGAILFMRFYAWLFSLMPITVVQIPVA